MAVDNDTVEYRDVPGFPGYRIGDDGSVWSCLKRGTRVGRGCRFSDTWRRLIPRPHARTGHMQVSLQKHPYSVHRLVLLAFVGPCPEGMEACHFPDRDPSNNRLINLRWDTRGANRTDSAIHGTIQRGERHHKAVTTDAQVIAIREEFAAGGRQSDIAKRHGLSRPVICDIVNGKSWRHSYAIAPALISPTRDASDL